MDEVRLFSRARCERLTLPGVSPLSADARQVLRAMLSLGAIGPESARTQAVIAAESGVPERAIQDANLELLAHGVVVCSTCRRPYGQFLARTAGETAAYRGQLTARATANFEHRQALDAAVRLAADAAAHERAGAGTLFAMCREA